MNYLGIDFHKNYTIATMINQSTKVLESRKLYNRKEYFAQFLKPYSEVSVFGL